jgi:hypothetical protein
MNIMKKQIWNKSELEFFQSISTPSKIQEFLDSIRYDEEVQCRSPRFVISEKKAHCFEGALFAAAALEQIGHPALVVDLLSEKDKDDDHVIAIYKIVVKRKNYFGSVAKTNTTVLAGRDPVYSSLHELVMSYYDGYCNLNGERTLRGYSQPVDLRDFDDINWRTTPEDLQPTIGQYLTDVSHEAPFPQELLSHISIVPQKQLEAIIYGANRAGLFGA